MQTILGAGGSIGLEMARILPDYTDKVRLVSRNPQPVNSQDELCPANLLNADEVERAVRDSEVVYLLAGLPYKAQVWEAQWPVIMRNVIAACRACSSKLVFFDNIYMYDRDHLSPMDEDTPIRPTSRKGAVREKIANLLLTAVQKGEIEGLIARCADFYGPGKQKTSVLTQTVFERLANRKSAQWFLSTESIHSFTYIPDAARGTAMLGNTGDAYGQVWHLPTASAPLTGRQWIETIASELGVEPKVQRVTRPMLSVLGLLVPVLRELGEMAYQYDRDYDFRSDKFNSRFGFEPTGYSQGIKAIVDADYRQVG
jgi:nucleoside-diphosphate-sugar epimerase